MTRLTLTLTLLALAVASAAPTGAAHAGDADSCENHGSIVIVGSYTCNGDCKNHGILVWVGRTCFTGDSIAGACLASKCITGPDAETAGAA